ncbi:MAG: HmuY family protein [Sphingobacterium sp.]
MNTAKTIKQLTILTVLFLSACGRDEETEPILPPSDGSRLTLQGGEGGSDAINAVYVDLSSDAQQSVKRDSWTLGFYSGDTFRVILNNQWGISAVAAGETDIGQVNASNADINQLAYDYTSDKLALYDDTLGVLEGTVIAEINADASANQVYLINTAHGTNVAAENVWKIKIDRSDDGGYQLQYGKLSDNEVQTLAIHKNPDFNYRFISLSEGQIEVEPAKDEWDFVWTKSMFYTTMGSAAIPYFYSDLVFINSLAGVRATEVIRTEDQPSYEDFDESNLGNIQFSDSRNVIASHWRVTTGSGVLKDRFYLIRDSSGNVYKLKFLVMGVEDSGQRGYPELEYQLIKNN